ncbi:hypothetical protein DID75_00335 [Candidatus Marinamargulisbacteria bacterium SCGC AG-410-N11]|nr:hypothetical protein DID75_00335 [Candidatus Marinamargulisbacteria bacterium SCGC AG-410-N11]
MSLAYIFPTNLEHAGLKIKFLGQLKALSKKYYVRSHYFNYLTSDNLIKKLCLYLWFEIKSCLFIMVSSRVYIRYNPKSIFTNCFSILFSIFKPIYLEHNSILSNELPFINRTIENQIHALFYWLFKYFPFSHVSVTKEIKNHLMSLGFKSDQIMYIQNGYLPPDKNEQFVNQSLIERVKSFQHSYQKLAIFVGNGYSWHGIQSLISITEQFPDLGFIIVGPYNINENHKNLMYTGKQSPETISQLYKMCFIGIGSLNFKSIQLTEACPLKTREYLANGLPILVNYKDCASDIPELSPYIFHLDLESPQTTMSIIMNQSFDHHNIQSLALSKLSWETLLADI